MIEISLLFEKFEHYTQVSTIKIELEYSKFFNQSVLKHHYYLASNVASLKTTMLYSRVIQFREIQGKGNALQINQGSKGIRQCPIN